MRSLKNIFVLVSLTLYSSAAFSQPLINLTKTTNSFFERSVYYTWTATMTLDTDVEKPLVVPPGQSRIAKLNYEIIRDPSILKSLNAPSFIVDQYFVKGEICVANNSNQRLTNIRIIDRVQEHIPGTEDEYRDIPGANHIIRPKRDVWPGETECFPYSILYREIENRQLKDLSHSLRNNASLVAFLGNQEFILEIFKVFAIPSGNPTIVREVDKNAGFVFFNLDCPDGFSCPTPAVVGTARGNETGFWNYFITNEEAECGESFELEGGILVFRPGEELPPAPDQILAEDAQSFMVTTGDCK